ncbi:hypothetical protein KSF_056470 [Reticulibacter mediterranei]|uniref:Uncharacterized protein n=1 Tax=Reticulibacter mediterranei TaxID=2778369 RepID=A0A8J3IPP7_9CHLR|nr:hypothetical protein [Reticulibacter mediterranei]GHO95599.1 hypothetical protein KSF_056470 [Reticulibacter mediterranei]
MPGKATVAEKILANLKGLRKHLQEDEQPLATIPGIWDAGQGNASTACDIVLTNQRLFGYYFVSFPRERLFLDALPLSSITGVSLRKKSFEPLFRELQINSGRRKVYVRASRQKIEELYSALHSAIETTSEEQVPSPTLEATSEEQVSSPALVYERQEVHNQFETSPLGITVLFVGGLILEMVGAILWMRTGSSAMGLPLCFAGLLAVFFAIRTGRQRARQDKQ